MSKHYAIQYFKEINPCVSTCSCSNCQSSRDQRRDGTWEIAGIANTLEPFNRVRIYTNKEDAENAVQEIINKPWLAYMLGGVAGSLLGISFHK